MKPKKIVIYIGARDGLLFGFLVAAMVYGIVSVAALIASLLFKVFA